MTSTRWCSSGVLVIGLAACGGDSTGVNQVPVANFSSQCAAFRCDFHDRSADSDGSVAAWSWTFGDGGTSAEVNPFHIYAAAGTYPVTLTITDDHGATETVSKQVVATEPVVATLSCADASAPGAYVSCTVTLSEPASYQVALQRTRCVAHGNLFRITKPVVDTLTTDGCYEQPGKTIERSGPFPAGTEIDAEVVAPLLASPPRLRVAGSYPTWTLEFEDGADTDFNDLVLTLTAVP